MEENSAQTIATFTGTLLRRKRMPGKPFVQLVFREAEKDWLCLSSNLKHVASLQIGKKYQIEGIFKTMGEHQYIHEPNIMPIAREIKKRRVLISVGLALGVVLAAGGIVLAATHDPSAPKQDAPASTSAQPQTTKTTDDTYTGTPTDNTPSDTPPADTSTTTPPATAPTTTPKTTPKTTTSNNSTPPPQNNSQIATPPALQPHCDAIVSIALDPIITPDNTQTTNYVLVTKAGVPKETQTCYPDVGTANPTTKTIQDGSPEERTVGTLPPDPNPNPNPGG